jgi:hypothetical protein
MHFYEKDENVRKIQQDLSPKNVQIFQSPEEKKTEMKT